MSPEFMNFIAKYWIEVLFGGVVSVATALYKHHSNKRKKEKQAEAEREAHKEEERKLLKLGVLALLHDRIYEIGENCLTKKEITVDQLDNLQHLFEAYQPLGGNGTGETMFNRCKHLPLIKEDETDEKHS